MKIVECVPNFSEGKDKGIIEAIANEIRSTSNVKLLDIDPGADTNRTVVTFIGTPEGVKEAAFKAIKKASELIDMRKHKGSHPRIGATDVCPFVPVSDVTMEECVKIANELGKQVAEELNIPIYLYEYAATKPERKNLADIRKGEYEGLEEKLKDPNWAPDYGEAKFNVKSGATVIGARDFLIAYNVNLNTKDKKLANEIALEIREQGRNIKNEDGKFVKDENGNPVKKPGIFKNVKAIGWYIDTYRQAQVSINLTNYEVSPLHEVFEECRRQAEKLGLLVTGSEIVGLVPKKPLLLAGRYFLKKQGKSCGVPEEELIEIAIQSLGLNSVAPFDPKKKIIEYQFEEAPLVNMSVKEFVNEVSKDSPAPGGGSAAALCGALGAALTSMVANLSTGKKFKKVEPEMFEIAEKAQFIKEKLLCAVDEDTQAFNQVITAMKLPHTTEEEIKLREEAIEEGYKSAAKVPLNTVKLCLEILPLAKKVAELGNKNSLSDAGVAALSANSGLQGAILNVKINLKNIKDQDFNNKMNEELRVYQEESEKITSEILQLLKNL